MDEQPSIDAYLKQIIYDDTQLNLVWDRTQRGRAWFLSRMDRQAAFPVYQPMSVAEIYYHLLQLNIHVSIQFIISKLIQLQDPFILHRYNHIYYVTRQ